MRQFSTHQLLSLLDKHGPPCISLYQYTHRHHPDSLQDPIRYRNLLREMESSLLQKYDKKEVRPLLEKFQPLSHDGEFWNHRTDGLAMLAYDARLCSSWSHLSALRPNRIMSLSTVGWCHITSTPSGTSPSILRLIVLIRAP